MALVAWLVLAGVATVAAVAFGIGLGVPARLPHGTRGVLLRWGHAVVWAILAVVFLALAAGPPFDRLAPPLGLLALGTYGAFLGALLTKGRE